MPYRLGMCLVVILTSLVSCVHAGALPLCE
jgi:hypothetical protein